MIAVFDIDGVLADPTHRQHHVAARPKDWDAFFAAVGGDDVLEAGRARLRELAVDHEVVLLSGRPESTRAETEAWLARHGIAVSRLVLRRDADFRPAAQVKAELIVGHRRAGSGGRGGGRRRVRDDPTGSKRLHDGARPLA